MLIGILLLMTSNNLFQDGTDTITVTVRVVKYETFTLKKQDLYENLLTHNDIPTGDTNEQDELLHDEELLPSNWSYRFNRYWNSLKKKSIKNETYIDLQKMGYGGYIHTRQDNLLTSEWYTYFKEKLQEDFIRHCVVRR